MRRWLHDETLLLRLALISLAVLLIVGAILQLRPFWFDTTTQRESLLTFDAHRELLMAGAWLRGFLCFPLLVLAGYAGRLTAGGDRIHSRVGSLLLVAAGALNVVAAALCTVVGVPAEEHRIIAAGTAEARAYEVLADTLFWAQDIALTFAGMCLALGLAFLSWAMWRTGQWPRGVVLAGFVAVPFAFAVSLAFVVMLHAPAVATVWHAVATWGFVLCSAAWALGVLRRSPLAAHA